MLIQKVFDDMDVQALSNVEERLVVDDLSFAVDHHRRFFHVKTKMQMMCGKLHSEDPPVTIKKRSAALPSQSGRAHFDAKDLSVFVPDMAGNDPVYGETGNLGRGGSPFDIVGGAVVCEVREFRERKSQPAKAFSLPDLVFVFQKEDIARLII